MGNGNQDDSSAEQPRAQEGEFDPQLLFSAPFIEAPPPLASIVKRDGSIVPFDKHKIAQAIFRAAQTIGGSDSDRAESIASGVAIYLAKKLNGQTPTVDQVDDAVERVLIEMGHGRTALAYARYRDRRARVRTLRQGDARSILSELEEAGREREETRAPESASLFVRTSAETLAGWNRERITEALVRETGLDEARASLIAMEVEQQIVSAHVRTLTTALIRELVSAKLIEHGLEAYHRRHMRLGVPLYDAERIIRGLTGEGTPQDPEATSSVLAESVKREFALSQVFTADVADAHVRGDLHIHDLGAIDRLHRCVQSLEYVTRFGVRLRNSRTHSKPPKYPDTVLAQMVNWDAALRTHFAGALNWAAINVFFAPFLDDLSDKPVRQIAQMLVYEWAYRTRFHGGSGPATEIGICWDIPPILKRVEAIGPGGVSERMYGEYADTAQRFAWALIDVLTEGAEAGAPFPAPVPVVHVTPGFFRSQTHEGFLEHVSKLAACGGQVRFALGRNFGRDDALETWQPRDVAVQRVTLNLARAAYRAHHEKGLLAETDRLVALAARAHAQKRDFVEQLLSFKEFGPLGLLAAERAGEPYLNLHRATYLVGVTGLNECVQHLTGEELHASEDARTLAFRLLEHLNETCAQWSERFDLWCTPAHTDDARVSHRFAAIDLQEMPEPARRVVKSDPVTHDLFYTGGARLNTSQEVSPIERVRLEGDFHQRVPTDALTIVRLLEGETSPRSIADFIRKAYHQTLSRGIALRE